MSSLALSTYAYESFTPWATLTEEEMFAVDGGAWGAKQWTACGLIVAGADCAIVSIAIPPAAAGGMTTAAKCWATAGVVLSASGGIVAI